MTIDWSALHYDPIYRTLGVAATITGSDFEFDCTLIHAANPVDNGAFGVNVPTLRPVMCVRASELASNDTSPDSLRGAVITFADNDDALTIEGVDPRPGPMGRATGEYALLLKDTTR